jgi:hypothetical protein
VGLDCVFHTYHYVQVANVNDLMETLDLSGSIGLGLLETPAHAKPLCGVNVQAKSELCVFEIRDVSL